MIDFPYLNEICIPNSTKIIFLVVDGLGGLPHLDTRKSELETAVIPNLDQLTKESVVGVTTSVIPGVTPGSGPGHMALFGYDPLKYVIGRGVLEAMGMGLNLAEDEVAARGNFCTVNDDGIIVDRRAGRIPTEQSILLVEILDQIEFDVVDLSVYPVQDHRFVLVMKGRGLGDRVTETDPLSENSKPLPALPISLDSELTARIANDFVSRARQQLQGRDQANMVTLRGFSSRPVLPDMGLKYMLKPAVIAGYPMYRGLARLIGMEVIETDVAFHNAIEAMKIEYDNYDFFFIHYKPADTAGEDGDFDAKVHALEALDRQIPKIVEMEPDVLVVAGDHSTPSVMGGHSWHPVPLLIRSGLDSPDDVSTFSEKECAGGSVGRISASNVMLIALAHAGRLQKFGP